MCMFYVTSLLLAYLHFHVISCQQSRAEVRTENQRWILIVAKDNDGQNSWNFCLSFPKLSLQSCIFQNLNLCGKFTIQV